MQSVGKKKTMTKKMSGAESAFCTCKWIAKDQFVADPDCPQHNKVGGLVSSNAKVLIDNDNVIPIASIREDVPPIELRIHGATDPELRAAIERAVRKAMENTGRCTCDLVADQGARKPDCPIHGEKKEE